MKTSILLIVIFIFISGCSYIENIENTPTKKAKVVSENKWLKSSLKPLIEVDIDTTFEELNKQEFNAQTCANFINLKAKYLLDNGEKEYISSRKQLQLIKNRSHIIVKKLFYLRLELRKHLIGFSKKNSINESCLSSFRKAFRYIRFLEEFITEVGISKYAKKVKANPNDFSNNHAQLFVNPKYKTFELKSGDVLLMRPSNYVSAAIARIGDDDGQFSHGALVYVDENKKIFIIESLITKGLVITPYELWRTQNDNARIAQFRMRQDKRAAYLAKKFYEKREENFNNKSIVYDFQMDDRSVNELFCTEVIFQTFKEENIPTYKTSFKKFKNHDFLKKLTIEVQSVFSPSDIEIEPKFEQVSEWRNYDTTNLTRIQDAVITSIFKWMSNDNFKLKTTLGSSFKTNFGYYGRHLFGLFNDKIPLNMPYEFLQTIVELGTVNELLESHLVQKNKNYILAHGYPMSYSKMLEELEKFKGTSKNPIESQSQKER